MPFGGNNRLTLSFLPFTLAQTTPAREVLLILFHLSKYRTVDKLH
ncbi:hypothetical protein DsansV1_C36g0232071 [Dioscorea sansibarensis]